MTSRPEEIYGIKYLPPKPRRMWFVEELLDTRFSIWEKKENSLKKKDFEKLLEGICDASDRHGAELLLEAAENDSVLEGEDLEIKEALGKT